MNSSYYKNCIVPKCRSTSKKTPDKLFIYVPNNKQIRKQWLTLARRIDAHSLSRDSRMYFCEDHFDLPNDMVNYTQYHIMGKVSQVRMKPGCTPSKFDCQEKRKNRTCSTTEDQCISKKQRSVMIAESLNESESYIPSSSLNYATDTNSSPQTVGSVSENEKTVDESVPAFIIHKFRTKAVQTDKKLTDQAISPLKLALPISNYTYPSEAVKLSMSGQNRITRNTLLGEEDSDSDICVPSVESLQIEAYCNGSELIEENCNLEAKATLLNTIRKIERNPLLYIGVPSSCYHIVNLLGDVISIPKHHLLLCLNKIRLDSKFCQLADDYGMTPSRLSEIFLESIPILAGVMHSFILEVDREIIKGALPIPHRHKYHVSCIIDCLEVEVEKPSEAVNHALTWSDHTKANTIKYLISCTSNGLVNYISPGFGGRITDACLLKSCDFVKTLKGPMRVMVDKGFKNVEKCLANTSITILSLPSVKSETGMETRSDIKLATQVASLRRLKNSVIRRLREFYMLKPNAFVNIKFVKNLDDIMIIACALINLQDSIIELK